MNKYKIIKKILVGIVLAFFIFVGTGIIISMVYKKEIISFFLKETNKHITTPIDVEKIEVSFFNHFPNISVNLHNVTVMEGSNQNQGILGKAKLISASFNPVEILNKNYTIHGIHLSDGEVTLRIDKDGQPNYLFYKKNNASEGSMFALKNITCDNLNIDYLDQKSNYHISFFVKNANAQLAQVDTILHASVKGSLVCDEIKVVKRKFLNNKLVDIDTEFDIDLRNRVYNFKSGGLEIDEGQFDVKGMINISDRLLDLKFNGVNTTFQSLNALLSNDLSKYLKDYKSRGNVYFSGIVKGKYGNPNLPMVNLEFGAKKASFFHPGYKKQITDVDLEGVFTTGKINHQKNYQLNLNNFSCLLEDKLLECSLVIRDFQDYQIDLILKGQADVNTLLLLFPKNYVKTAFGTINIDMHVNGHLKNPKLSQNVDANGEIEFQNVSFVLTGKKLPFNKINGSIQLRKNDLAISKLSGFVGNSDFLLNGFIKDISTLLSQKNKKYKMQADLQSKHIDFDELLKSNFASRDTTGTKNKVYEFKISSKIDLDFNCEVGDMKFKRFRGRDIMGNIEIKNQIAVLKNVSFSSMGGKVKISGSVNSKRENLIETISEAYLYNINVDSVFYVFKNFNQDWLIDKNLKGQLDADINLYMNFNKNLVLNSKSLVADIHTSIANGELNNFEPMMELSKFVEEESLAHMRFSRMTNEIKIDNRTIYLPEMEIRSNISNILISGTHSFDNNIDYHLSVPLKSFIRISKKKDYQQSARHGMNLLLKLTGHTSNYTISYDTQALKDNFKKDFLDEGKEWKSLKKKDTIIIEEVPELEEEYFEFEDSETDSIRNQGY